MYVNKYMNMDVCKYICVCIYTCMYICTVYESCMNGYFNEWRIYICMYVQSPKHFKAIFLPVPRCSHRNTFPKVPLPSSCSSLSWVRLSHMYLAREDLLSRFTALQYMYVSMYVCKYVF